MAELSQEMKVQILSRLPPKSLMRFKCVEKWWHGLINSPNFVAKQVSFANSNKHNKLSSSDGIDILLARYILDLNTGNKELVFSLLDLPHSVMYDDHDDDDGHHLSVSDDDDLHVPILPDPITDYGRYADSGLNIACHCDGIICLTDYREKTVLCNPSIKQFNCLPVTSNLLLACASGIYKPSAAVGFGYAKDALNNDSKNYKVVRILDYGVLTQDGYDSEYFHIVQLPPKAEVYSLVTNLWKEIKVDNLDKETRVVMPDSTASIYFKGTLYWSGSEENKDTKSDDKDRVITFDLANEIMEGGLHCSFQWWVSSLYSNEHMGAGYECSSWTKYLTLDPVPHDIRETLALSTLGENGGVFLVAADESVFILYDVSTERFKYIPIRGTNLDSSQSVFYVKTIISINPTFPAEHHG